MPSDPPTPWPTEWPAGPADPPTTVPTAVVDPLPHVPAAPTGTWTSLHWTALPATADFGARTPVTSPDPYGGPDVSDGTTFQVFGWSRGFVGFALTPPQDTGKKDSDGNGIYTDPSLTSSYSADGVHWNAGGKLTLANAGNSSLMAMRTVIEGPAGLLAVGWTEPCGDQYVDSLWTSIDGISWAPVDVSKVFGSYPVAITHISGGAAGFVAVAYKNAGAWTSRDGRNWTPVALNARPFANSFVDDGTSFAGGFVLAGVAGDADCGGSIGPQPTKALLKASVWWSADSSTWTRISLPGAASVSGYEYTWVSRLSDQSLMVMVGGSAWGSKDGRTYKAIKLPTGVDQPAIVSVGQHNLVVEGAMGKNDIGDPMAVLGKLRLRTIEDNFAAVSVAQSGSVPELVYDNVDYPYGLVAIGPTGVVVTNVDGTQLWFGTPSAK